MVNIQQLTLFWLLDSLSSRKLARGLDGLELQLHSLIVNLLWYVGHFE